MTAAVALGVADGVGGWRRYGIDPSEFSSRLMKICFELVKSGLHTRSSFTYAVLIFGCSDLES